jgi:DNA-directed RNA polymerase subunit RPC12/RpoP
MKVTEKQLKSRVSELNMGILRETTFGIKMERGNKGYDVNLVYRDQTAPEILLAGGSAAEANACIEAVAVTHKIYKQSMLGGLEKPEFMTNEMFLKKNGDRCPKTKCGSRDLISGWGEKSGESFTQVHRCAKCSLEFTKIYKLELIRAHSPC